MREKASKGTFLKPEKLENHSNERKRTGREEEKSNGCTVSFYNTLNLEILAGKNLLMQKDYLALTLSIIRLATYKSNKDLDLNIEGLNPIIISLRLRIYIIVLFKPNQLDFRRQRGRDGQRVAVRRSRVRVPLWPLAGFVLGRPEFKSSAMLVK